MDENHLDNNRIIDGAQQGLHNEDINISDVIEVIETDCKESTTMYNGGGEIQKQQQQPPALPPSHQQSHRSDFQSGRSRSGAYVKIIEQPASKALRFRYECEGRSAGSIPGASSTSDNKTFPSIQICDYVGNACVVVSCVTKDKPYRPHPHNLVGREGCRKGVCTLPVSTDTMTVTFSNLGIQCVKKKDIENALKVREEIKVDPFMTGFSHRDQPTSIDLNAVRLCFQVFLEGDKRGKYSIPLTPVVSNPIYDKKAMCDLIIVRLSHCNTCVDGSSKGIILLCEKVAKEDIQVRFFEVTNGEEQWEALGEFQPSHVHKQTAIYFKPPRYRNLEITEPVNVYVQLRRPSDGATSEPKPFQFLPLDAEPGMLKRKRQKLSPVFKREDLQNSTRAGAGGYSYVPSMEPVKLEPRDKSPSPYGGHMYGGGVSPIYAQDNQQQLSPYHNNQLMPPGGASSLLPPINTWNHPSLSPVHNDQWNILSPPATNNNTNIATNITNNDLSADNFINIVGSNDAASSGFSCMLDMDTQQSELKQLNLLSGELDNHNLSASFSASLSLADIGPLDANTHMTDSYVRLAHSAIDKLQ